MSRTYQTHDEEETLPPETCAQCGTVGDFDSFCSSSCFMAFDRAKQEAESTLRRTAFSYVAALCGGRGCFDHDPVSWWAMAGSPVFRTIEGARNTHMALGRVA